MRYVILFVAALLSSSALAHPHHDCPKNEKQCDQHKHPDPK